MQDCLISEVAAELPEFSPRFIAYSYCHTHDDGRVSYPLVFIHYCPSGRCVCACVRVFPYVLVRRVSE